MWTENTWQKRSSNTKILRTEKIQALIQRSYILVILMIYGTSQNISSVMKEIFHYSTKYYSK